MKNAEKQNKFYQVALKLIHEQGFKATTMRDISKAMNFEVANVYNYTKSKLALLEHLLFDISDDFNDGLKLILNANVDTIEKIRRVISLYCKILSAKPYQVGLLVAEWRNLKDHKLKKFLDDKKWHEDQIIKLIKQGIDEGVINECDPYITTKSMLSSFNWLYLELAERKDQIKLAVIEQQITALLLSGLKA